MATAVERGGDGKPDAVFAAVERRAPRALAAAFRLAAHFEFND